MNKSNGIIASGFVLCLCFMADGGCDRNDSDSNEDAEDSYTVPLVTTDNFPMWDYLPEDIKENDRRLCVIDELRDSGRVAESIPLLISMLDGVTYPPPHGFRGLPRYSHEEAAEELKKLGKKAYPALMDALRNDPDVRGAAYLILAYQGHKPAFDFVLSLPETEGYASSVDLYLPRRGPTDLELTRKFYFKNRERLVFDTQIRAFRLPDKNASAGNTP